MCMGGKHMQGCPQGCCAAPGILYNRLFFLQCVEHCFSVVHEARVRLLWVLGGPPIPK